MAVEMRTCAEADDDKKATKMFRISFKFVSIFSLSWVAIYGATASPFHTHLQQLHRSRRQLISVFRVIFNSGTMYAGVSVSLLPVAAAGINRSCCISQNELSDWLVSAKWVY